MGGMLEQYLRELILSDECPQHSGFPFNLPSVARLAHSSIILAYPNATLYHFSSEGINEEAHEETEPFIVTTRLLNDRQSMLNTTLNESTNG